MPCLMLGYNGGFWSEWINPQKCTFDGVNRLILVNQGITAIDVTTDIYSDWKEWVQSYDNAKWLPAVNSIGGEPTPDGRIGATFFLLNGWRIKPWQGDYRLTVNGNLYTTEGDNPFLSISGVSVSSTVSDLNTMLIERVEVEKVIEATLSETIEATIIATLAKLNEVKDISSSTLVNTETLLNTVADVDSEEIADTVWRKSLTDYTDPTSAGKQISDIRKHTTNKAVISADGEIVTVYDDDGQTILHQFLVSSDKLSRTPIQ